MWAPRTPGLPSHKAPAVRPGESEGRQRRRGWPENGEGAPNKAALGGPNASASSSNRPAKLPVTLHRWRWPMTYKEGARVGARARLDISGIGRR
ncbi:LOW QUALITY PROTEIN: uncharacterized protein LOC111728850 [Pteropus vampyrus]|uniref:LOW QUALITY PROTEIN: uncharacterized protein LOC111728850 n=1 Tax=Pteropus vampyrus TaxID=132908 RepID=A0A6P6BK76_PTEVA|nr:LOW QUALITY PROTEIN: uncharacterized protein LOC111728850 [Pteropus vampyrus]